MDRLIFVHIVELELFGEVGRDIDFRISNETQIGFVRDEKIWYPLQVISCCINKLNETKEIKGVEQAQATFMNQILPEWLEYYGHGDDV